MTGRHMIGDGGVLAGERHRRRQRRYQKTRALDACRKLKARLVIAKLDWLSRNLAFVTCRIQREGTYSKCVANRIPD